MSKNFFCGVVESRDDPLKLGRVRVRVVGCHTPNKTELPAEDLPWASISNSSIGIPKEGTNVTVEFWDYPENQMPIVTGVLNTIPQRNSVFVEKAESESVAQIKDDITPSGRSIPKNAEQSSGGVDKNVAVDKNNAPEAMKSAVKESVSSTQDTQTALVNAMTNSTSSENGVGTIAQFTDSIGSSVISKKDELMNNITQYGDIVEAQLASIKSLAEKLGTSVPTDLLKGNLTTTDMMSNINETLKNLTTGLGVSDASTLINKLSSIDMDVVGSELVDKVKFALSGQLGNLPKDISLDGIVDNINAIKTLNLGSIADFSGMASTGLNALTSELSNLSAMVNDASDSLAQSFTENLSSLSSVADPVSSKISSLVGSISLPSSLIDILGTSVSDMTTALTDNVSELVGKGYSSVMALANDVGGVKTAENAVVEAESKKTDLKDTNVSQTKDNFKDVQEGKTPPMSGNNGGANFGGANATVQSPTINDTKSYPYGVSRGLDTSWISSESKLISQKDDLDLLISVAQSEGLTTTEGLASYLAIIYGSNGAFVPSTENIIYSETELKRFFPITFSKATNDTIREYSLGKTSEKDFLSFVYDSANDGITYGNQYPSDGWKFRGYGYVKIIGRSAYTKYAKLLNLPKLITEGADYLASDKNLTAKISVLEFLQRTASLSPTAHPNLFYQCCDAFGLDASGIEEIYCKFYGSYTQDFFGVGRKIAGAVRNSSPLYTYAGDNSNYGFIDPNKKYPTEDEICESSLSKLSRGDIKNTIVTLKEQKRKINIPLPMNMGVWSQPHSSYGAHYPFNRVEESESGHIFEVDDTPNRERLHWYHRSGTFTEIDPSGVKVTRIVGDNYMITDRNGYISIDGEADVTVGGNINVYCRSNANIQVEGTANLEVGRNLDIGVAKDVNIRTEGNFNVWANGDFNVQAKNNGHILTRNNLYVAADKNVHMLSGYVDDNGEKQAGNLYVESYGNSDYRSLGNTKLYTVGSLSDKVDGARYNEVKGIVNNMWLSDVTSTSLSNYDLSTNKDIRLHASNSVHMSSDAILKISTSDVLNLKASANVNVDGAEIHLNDGIASTATLPSNPIEESDFENNLPYLMSSEATKALINGMIPPSLGTPLNVRMSPIEIPMPGDVDGVFETETETASQEFTKINEMIGQSEGCREVDSGVNEVITACNKSGVKVDTVVGENFSKDFKLSKHFRLGDFTTNATFPHTIPKSGQKGLTEAQIVTNLQALAQNVVEKMLDYLPNGINGKGKDWIITSGFRKDSSPSNAKNSQHTMGMACDIQLCGRKNNNKDTYDLIKKVCEHIPFDQAILEYSTQSGKCWIHISFNNINGNRPSSDVRKMMTMHPRFKTASYQSIYKSGFHLC